MPMNMSGWKAVAFSTTTCTITFDVPFEKVILFVPTLATDTSATLSLSYDGTTYLTVNRIEGADNQTDVIVNSARCQIVEVGGCKHLKLTCSNSQTGTVYARGIR